MRIEFRPNNLYSESRCVLCGEWFKDDDIYAVALAQEGDDLGDVCEECVQAGPEGIVARMRDQASRLRRIAAELESLVAEGVQAPGYDEWQRMLAARRQEIADERD
jgi:hypothetical protein